MKDNYWVSIENRKTWIIDKYEQINPADETRYIKYWGNIKRKFIEGLWAEDFGKWRFCPAKVQFYVNMTVILDVDERTKSRKAIRPLLRDLEWTMGYGLLEARGFSGFEEDSEYTCYLPVKTAKSLSDIPKHIRQYVVKSNGELKTFMNATDYLKKLHNKPLGKCLYQNQAKNFIVVGSRGGGKTYFISLSEALHDIVFDGAKYYDDESIQKPNKTFVCIGSADTSKSGEFLSKMEDCLNEYAINPDLGVWSTPGLPDYMPNIFYKDMAGSLNAGNKATKGWRHSYKKKINGEWISGFGTGSTVYHVSYSDKKKDGAEAAAGGRYNTSIVEETGLVANVRQVFNSNIATVSNNATSQFGVQIYLGTSGNMETVLGTKEMFNSPDEYNMISYPNSYENSDAKIGFFLPAEVTMNNHKDDNGNTDFVSARLELSKMEDKRKESKNPLALRMHRMNYPTKPSHMWVDKKGKILPSELAADVVEKLEKGNLYKQIGLPVKLSWDKDERNKVRYDVDLSAQPFYEIHGWNNLDSWNGSVMIYEPPPLTEIPSDMYRFIGHDPYVSDNLDEGGSLGSTHVVMNPKYWATHMKKSPLVATYIGKPLGGKEEYYQNQEKLLALYGNPHQGLWYEANRGEACREYFMRKSKLYLLALRPQMVVGQNMFAKRITQYGWIVGSRVSKIQKIEMLRDWLLESITVNGETMTILETLPCIFTLKQIVGFDLDEGNWDAVMSLVGSVLGIKEQQHYEEDRAVRRTVNKLAHISMHHKLKINRNEHKQ